MGNLISNTLDKICYRCNTIATSVEHVPAKCFFPKEHRKNLITVPSCEQHNQETSKDDEYVRGIIVASKGNNKMAKIHWKGMVRQTFLKRPKLFLTTYSDQRENSFFHDRRRMDGVMVKIAHALYFKEYSRHWLLNPYPFYENMFDDDGKSDIEVRLPDYKSIPSYHLFSGENPEIFRYYFLEGKVGSNIECLLKMTFYGGFSVLILPLGDDHRGDPLTTVFHLK